MSKANESSVVATTLAPNHPICNLIQLLLSFRRNLLYNYTSILFSCNTVGKSLTNVNGKRHQYFFYL